MVVAGRTGCAWGVLSVRWRWWIGWGRWSRQPLGSKFGSCTWWRNVRFWVVVARNITNPTTHTLRAYLSFLSKGTVSRKLKTLNSNMNKWINNNHVNLQITSAKQEWDNSYSDYWASIPQRRFSDCSQMWGEIREKSYSAEKSEPLWIFNWCSSYATFHFAPMGRSWDFQKLQKTGVCNRDGVRVLPQKHPPLYTFV